MRGAGNRERHFCRDRKTRSTVAHPHDGGRMKHVLTRFGLASLIVAGIAGAMWFSLSIGAAEPPLPKALPAPTGGDGALFTAVVPVLRHPRSMYFQQQGNFS